LFLAVLIFLPNFSLTVLKNLFLYKKGVSSMRTFFSSPCMYTKTVLQLFAQVYALYKLNGNQNTLYD